MSERLSALAILSVSPPRFGYLRRSLSVKGLRGPEERRETSSLATSVTDGGYDQLVGGAAVDSPRTNRECETARMELSR